MSIDVYMYFLPVGRNTLAFDHIYDDSLKQKSSNKKLYPLKTFLKLSDVSLLKSYSSLEI